MTFTTTHGLVLDNAGVPTAPRPGDLPDVGPYKSPCGERLKPYEVTFTPTEGTRPGDPVLDDSDPAVEVGVVTSVAGTEALAWIKRGNDIGVPVRFEA